MALTVWNFHSLVNAELWKFLSMNVALEGSSHLSSLENDPWWVPEYLKFIAMEDIWIKISPYGISTSNKVGLVQVRCYMLEARENKVNLSIFVCPQRISILQEKGKYLKHLE